MARKDILNIFVLYHKLGGHNHKIRFHTNQIYHITYANNHLLLVGGDAKSLHGRKEVLGGRKTFR